jgi:hypothetical protein
MMVDMSSTGMTHHICLIIIPKIIFELGPDFISQYIDLAMGVINLKIEFEWDYHVVGGRWDGYFKNGPVGDSAACQTSENNSGPVSELVTNSEKFKYKVQVPVLDTDFDSHIYPMDSAGEIQHSQFLQLLNKQVEHYYVNIDYHT